MKRLCCPQFAFVLAVAVSACSSLKGAGHQKAPETPAPASTQTEAPLPQPAPTNPPAQASDATASPSDAIPATAPCVPAESKPKPKYKPRPKVATKEATPQIPTAPVVTETPAGGVVDAQVKQMPVSVMSILGKRVQGAQGEDLGRVVDVLADANGRVRVAIVDFGGFLGVGDRRIAVDWPLLRFNPDQRDPSLLLSVSREKLKETPEYKDNPRPQTLMEPVPVPVSVPAAAGAPAAAPAPVETKK
jgi:sporulation protein YlmC with PRC-barrel domain